MVAAFLIYNIYFCLRQVSRATAFVISTHGITAAATPTAIAHSVSDMPAVENSLLNAGITTGSTHSTQPTKNAKFKSLLEKGLRLNSERSRERRLNEWKS